MGWERSRGGSWGFWVLRKRRKIGAEMVEVVDLVVVAVMERAEE